MSGGWCNRIDVHSSELSDSYEDDFPATQVIIPKEESMGLSEEMEVIFRQEVQVWLGIHAETLFNVTNAHFKIRKMKGNLKKKDQ